MSSIAYTTYSYCINSYKSYKHTAKARNKRENAGGLDGVTCAGWTRSVCARTRLADHRVFRGPLADARGTLIRTARDTTDSA
jgi:hypothetical protein